MAAPGGAPWIPAFAGMTAWEATGSTGAMTVSLTVISAKAGIHRGGPSRSGRPRRALRSGAHSAGSPPFCRLPPRRRSSSPRPRPSRRAPGSRSAPPPSPRPPALSPAAATQNVVNQIDKVDISVVAGYDGFIARPVPAPGQEARNGDSGHGTFSWSDVEKLPELRRLEGVLKALPDEELLASLEAVRGRGRDHYPVRAMWRAVVMFGRRSAASLVRECELRSGS